MSPRPQVRLGKISEEMTTPVSFGDYRVHLLRFVQKVFGDILKAIGEFEPPLAPGGDLAHQNRVVLGARYAPPCLP